MGYAFQPAKYVEYYKDVAESNELLAEHPTEYEANSSYVSTNMYPVAYYTLKMDIHYSSQFLLAYEYKGTVAGNINVKVLNQNDETVGWEIHEFNAAYQSGSLELRPYDYYDIPLKVNDVLTVYIFGQGFGSTFIKLQQLFGFKTPWNVTQGGAGP